MDILNIKKSTIIMEVVMMYENVERLHDGIITLSYPEEWECMDVLRVRTHGNR